MEIKVELVIEPADKLAEIATEGTVLSHIRSALYGRMGDFGWRSVQVSKLHEEWCGDPALSRPADRCTCHITPEQQASAAPPMPFGPAAHCRACAASGVGVCDDYPNCPAGRAEVKLEVHEDKSLENILERLHNED